MKQGLSGLSYLGVLALWVANIVFFAVMYYYLDSIPGQGVLEPLQSGPPVMRWYDALYFSVTTGTTLGFGDIVPIGMSRFFVGVQSLVSFILLALTVSKIASQRTERVLSDIHKLQREVHALLVKKDEVL